MKKLLYFFTMMALFSACRQDSDDPPTGEVAFHLITNFETVGNSCEIDPSTVEWMSIPFLSYMDLISYNPQNHRFALTEQGVDIVKNRDYPVDGVGFVLLANGALVYTGYFYPAYSSQSCDWVVIEPLNVAYNGYLEVRLGYPGEVLDGSIPDLRNDSAILNIFARDGKLVE